MVANSKGRSPYELLEIIVACAGSDGGGANAEAPGKGVNDVTGGASGGGVHVGEVRGARTLDHALDVHVPRLHQQPQRCLHVPPHFASFLLSHLNCKIDYFPQFFATWLALDPLYTSRV